MTQKSAREKALVCKGVRICLLSVAAAFLLSGCISDSGSNGQGSGGNSNSDSGSVDQGVIPQGEEITLSWTPPDSRTDGSPISLSEIDQYEVLFGNESGDYSESVSMAANSCHCYEFGRLAEGRYFVAVRVTDTNGVSSMLSSELSFTVRNEGQEGQGES